MSKPTLKERFQALLQAYGPVAFGTWFAIFFATWFGFWFAITQLGWEPEGMVGSAGTVGAAYLATQATKPARFALTLALTPLLGKLIGRDPTPEGHAADALDEDGPAPESPTAPPPGSA